MVNVEVDVAERVRHILSSHFQGARVNTQRSSGAERVSGYIVWEGFEKYDQVDRQALIRNHLREQLGTDMQYVSLILAYTPYEYKIMSVDNSNMAVVPDESFIRCLEETLIKRFGNRVHIDFPEGAHLASGYIISRDFENLNPQDQQTLVHTYLTEQLGADAQYVSVILTYTPHEYKIMSEGRYKPRKKRAKAA